MKRSEVEGALLGMGRGFYETGCLLGGGGLRGDVGAVLYLGGCVGIT